jgi:uncharacterized lipoprotein YddW (UPF0748 family)
MIKYCLIFLIILLSLTVPVNSQQFPDPETRGTWITGNFFRDKEAVESLVKKLKDANFNTIFVCTWYEGYTIYESEVVKNAGGQKQHPVFAGTDPMRTIIDAAHANGIEVFAWFEYGFSVGYSASESDPPQILKNHPDWSMVKRDGTKTEPDNYGGYFFWIDPAVSAAAQFMVDLYVECAAKYPDIDGIELDRMRYPYTSFSYSDTARARFMSETGNPDPLTLTNSNTAWAAWRREQVTSVVKRIYEGISEVNSRCIVTGAAVPPYMMAGQSDDKLQAWDVWAKNSYVDILEPMLYLPVSDYSYQLNLAKNLAPNGFQLAPGIAINSAGTVENTILEVNTTRNAGMAGEVLWYYGYLLSYPDALSEIRSSLYTSAVSPAHNDLIIDNASKGIFKTTGTWTNAAGGYKNSFKVSEAAGGNTAVYSVRILREGNYSLYGYWPGDSVNNCSSASVIISDGNFSEAININQQNNREQWNLLDIYSLHKGDTVTVTLTGSGGGNLIADAFRFRLNPGFSLSDYFMQDSQVVTLKFSNELLNPPADITRITSSVSEGNLIFNVDESDNSILHVNVNNITAGAEFTLNIENLVDVTRDTLSISVNVTYNPGTSELLIDDSTPDSFWKLMGSWVSDTSSSAVNNSFWYTKPAGKTVRAQWGPYTIEEAGYYDVYVNIPAASLPLTECFYVLKDEGGTDTVTVLQSSAAGNWHNLGSYSYYKGDAFSIMISSSPAADAEKYIAADAVKLKRTLNPTSVDLVFTPEEFEVSQNYPNPFNPSTTISLKIPARGHVSLKIYNMLGEEISQLVNEEKEAGNYNIIWNSNGFPSGVYFYNAIYNNRSQMKKMILLK